MEADLHPRLTGALQALEREDAAAAVQCALNEVERAVRGASGLPESLHGAALMRAAFEPGRGPLADPRKPFARQEETSNLFAGAFLVYRDQPAPSLAESAEVLEFASSLLAIVDEGAQDTARAARSSC